MKPRRYRIDVLLRRAAGHIVEMLGNEALFHHSPDELTESALTRECKLYCLRLLSLYLAAGYGRGHGPWGELDRTLRELESRELSEKERWGYELQQQLDLTELGRIMPLPDGQVFSVHAAPHLQKLRSGTLQQVLWLISTDLDGSRLNYETIGVNVLGSLSEWLLNGRGHVITEPTIEVHEKEMKLDDDARTYVVPASRLEEFDDDEVVRDSKGRPVIYGGR